MDAKQLGIWKTASAFLKAGKHNDALRSFDELDSALGSWEADSDVSRASLRTVASQAFLAAQESGQYVRALDYAEKELRLALTSPSQHFGMARALNNCGVAHMELGRLVEAEADLQGALKEVGFILSNEMVGPMQGSWRFFADPESLADQIHENLSVLWSLQGMHRRSAPLDDSRAGPARHLGLSFARIWNEDGTGAANDAFFKAREASARGDYADAIKVASEAVSTLRAERGAPRPLGIALSNLGSLLRDAGDIASAFDVLQESVAVLKSASRPSEALAISLHNLSQTHLRNIGWGAMASTSLALRGPRPLARVEATCTGMASDLPAAVTCAKEAWLEIEQVNPRTPQALRILHQLAILRVFTDDFKRARAALHYAMELYDANRKFFASSEEAHAGTFRTFRALTELMLIIAVHEQFPDEALDWIESAKARFWNERLDAIQHTRSSVSEADRERISEKRLLPEQLQLSNLRTDPNCLLLNYFVGVNYTFVVWSYNSQLGVFRIPVGEDTLREMIAGYCGDIRSSSRRPLWRQSGNKIAELLFRDVECASRIEKIVISPDGPLWFLPFDLLFWLSKHNPGSNDADVKCLSISSADFKPIAHVPSVRIHKRLRTAAEPWPSAQRLRLLVIARSRFSSLPPLPSVGGEARDVVDIAREHEVELLKEDEAVRTLVAPALAEADVIHIATHALSGPLEQDPAVILADGRGGDDPLTPSEIVQLRSKATLVFLSACSSALGRSSDGEGLNSIARAFLLAGARSVVASLWPVVDDDTATFVRGFYRALFSGKPALEALCFAKAEALQLGLPVSRVTAFQLIGDGDNPFDQDSLVKMARRAESYEET